MSIAFGATGGFGNRGPGPDDTSGMDGRAGPGGGVQRGESPRTLRLLTAAVAAGFGLLGWLGAQAVTLYLLGHGHLGADGRGFHHVHGYAAPTALAAAAMISASLLAMFLLCGPDTRSGPTRARPPLSISVAVPSGAFVALELVHAQISDTTAGPTLSALVLGVALQALFGVAAAGGSRFCIRLALTPAPTCPTLRSVAPARCARVVARPARVGSGWVTGIQGSRAPPIVAVL